MWGEREGEGTMIKRTFERMVLNIEQRIAIAETNKQIVTQKCLPRDFWIGYTEALTELLHDTEPVRLK